MCHSFHAAQVGISCALNQSEIQHLKAETGKAQTRKRQNINRFAVRIVPQTLCLTLSCAEGRGTG